MRRIRILEKGRIQNRTRPPIHEQGLLRDSGGAG
jgi:hypothetical protein